MARRKKKFKVKGRITQKETRGYIMTVGTTVGMLFVVSYLQSLIESKFNNPIILVVIGVIILLIMAFFFQTSK